MSIFAIPLTFIGLASVLLSYRYPNREQLIVFCIALSVISVGTMRAVQICPRLKIGGRTHPRWFYARVAVYLLLPQALLLWAVMFGLVMAPRIG